MKIGTTSRFLVVLLAVTASAAGAAYLGADPPAFGSGQLLARLPGGATVHSLLRAELDGRGPAEVAAVARIPAFPGARESVYTALVFRYNRLRRVYAEAYRAPAPGRIPFSVDAVALGRGREGVIFSGLYDDGTRAVSVLAAADGGIRPLSEAQARAALARLPAPVPAVTWRYAVRNGAVVARTSVVRVRIRQTVRVQPAGGGPASVVLPDPRLDVTESGYRARMPGRYRIRVVTGLLPPEEAYSLTVVVDP